MINHVLLLDVAPDPVSTGVGVIGLILIGIIVLMLSGAALVGFVFLFKRLRQAAGGSKWCESVFICGPLPVRC